MTSVVIPEGDALKPLWACFTDMPGTIPYGKFDGRVVHATASAEANGFLDGYSCLITQSERESGDADLNANVWMNQALSNLSIYSAIKQEPYLCCSCRLSASFFRQGSVASFSLSCVDNPSVQPFVLTFGQDLFKFSGPGVDEVDMTEDAAFVSAIDKINAGPRYLTRKFNLYITAQVANPPVVSPRAQYRTRVFVEADSKIFELYDYTRSVTWRERYTAKFNCYSRV